MFLYRVLLKRNSRDIELQIEFFERCKRKLKFDVEAHLLVDSYVEFMLRVGKKELIGVIFKFGSFPAYQWELIIQR